MRPRGLWGPTTASLMWGFAAGCAPAPDVDPVTDPPADTTPADTADADADGLTADAEAAAGTDPDKADTDGDGYRDGDELAAGSDPLDPASWIYAGGWPFNPEKDALPAGDGDRAALDARFRRLLLPDQHGQDVDLYDFAGHGVPVVVEVAGMWCAPCQQVAAMLAGETNELATAFPHVLPGLLDGRVLWLTVLVEDAEGGAVDAADVTAWANAWPQPRVPVLAGDAAVAAYAAPSSLPTVWLLDDQLVATALTAGDDGPVVLTLLEKRLAPAP